MLHAVLKVISGSILEFYLYTLYTTVDNDTQTTGCDNRTLQNRMKEKQR